jgi:serine protease Do
MNRFVGLLLGALLLPTYSEAQSKKIWIDGSEVQAPIELNLPSFSPVIEKLGKAVVNISTEGKENSPANVFRGRPQGNPPGEDEDNPRFNPFDSFPFAPEGESKRSFSSLGSGFVIHPDGFIVTNNHVVDRATKISVSFRDDRKTYPAKVIGKDRKTDLALLKVEHPGKLEAVVFGDSDKVAPGDWVIAIGNPFRLGHTATVGIVSATSRRVPGGGPYDDFIQTDASINPGNSGGPLFNARGEVIGVNTAIFSPGRFIGTGFNIGIGFATPINIIKGIIGALHDSGRVTRGWLGVLIQPVSEDLARALELPEAQGALVADVMAKSPAADAGIERGDVIVNYNGKPIVENDQLPILVANTELGKTVKLDVIRGGKSKTIEVKIRELKEEDEEQIASGADESKLGLVVQDLTEDIAKGLGVEEGRGVLVSNIVPDSAAAEAGLKRGDIILAVGTKEINSAKEFKSLTKDAKKERPLLLLVRRGENTIFLTLKLQ